MNNSEIESIIKQAMSDSDISVSGDGSKFEVTIISSAFDSLNTVKRHQLVYKLLNEHITSGAIHALTISAKTPNEVK